MTDITSDLLHLEEQTTDPPVPPLAHNLIFVKADGRFYTMDSAGRVVLLGGGLIEDRAQVQSYPVNTLEFPRKTLRNEGGAGRVTLVPRPAARQISFIEADNTTVRGTAVATDGTITAVNSTDTGSVQCASGGAQGDFTGARNNPLRTCRIDHNPIFHATFTTGATIANTRYWVGLYNPAPTFDVTSPVDGVGLAANILASGNWFFQCWDNDTLTEEDFGSLVVASTLYKIRIRVDYAIDTAYFSLNNSAEVAVTGLPANSVDLGMVIRIVNVQAATRNFRFSRASVEWGNN